jgi:ADP-heptose:LPS heptosyltransferase
MRTLMASGEPVVLETFYCALYQDLMADGLQIQSVASHHPPRIREYAKFPSAGANIPGGANYLRMSYNAELIRKHGSILAAQYSCVGLPMPARPDFSLPVPDQWRQMARRKIGAISKPLMVYRPTVLNNLFHCEPRLPDIKTYATLFESIRDSYHVVSVANLGDNGEHIAGQEMPADTKFHRGELAFEELAGLYAEADLAFTCAGFAPVLAQSVGTPTVIVYGGHEGFKTTNSVGSHLAPTLAIEPANPCECHAGHYFHVRSGLMKPTKTHECDKTIDVHAALQKLQKFVEHEQRHE